jgi:hypothetical protein
MPSPGQWRGGWSGFPVVKDEDINDAALWYQIDHALNEKNWALGARYWPRVNIQWGGGGPGQQVFQDHLFDSSRTPVMGPDPNDPTKTINLNPNSWEVNYFAGAASHKDADYPGTFDLILGADAYDKRYSLATGILPPKNWPFSILVVTKSLRALAYGGNSGDCTGGIVLAMARAIIIYWFHHLM